MNKMEKLNFWEKMAMLWVLPIAVALVIVITALSAAIWLAKVVLVYSGTAGALGWIVGQIEARYKASKWARLKKEDAQLAEFERRFNP
jgi:fatty acid desaturase